MSAERNRAWRRLMARQNKHGHQSPPDYDKPEKNWKLIYLRSNKLARARQLGIDYPRRSPRQLVDAELKSDE